MSHRILKGSFHFGDDMGDVNQPWLARNIVEECGIAHNFPEHSNRLFPKFDSNTSIRHEYDIEKFILSISMNIQHKDVICQLFLYIFKNKVSTCWEHHWLEYFLDSIYREVW